MEEEGEPQPPPPPPLLAALPKPPTPPLEPPPEDDVRVERDAQEEQDTLREPCGDPFDTGIGSAGFIR